MTNSSSFWRGWSFGVCLCCFCDVCVIIVSECLLLMHQNFAFCCGRAFSPCLVLLNFAEPDMHSDFGISLIWLPSFSCTFPFFLSASTCFVFFYLSLKSALAWLPQIFIPRKEKNNSGSGTCITTMLFLSRFIYVPSTLLNYSPWSLQFCSTICGLQRFFFPFICFAKFFTGCGWFYFLDYFFYLGAVY